VHRARLFVLPVLVLALASCGRAASSTLTAATSTVTATTSRASTTSTTLQSRPTTAATTVTKPTATVTTVPKPVFAFTVAPIDRALQARMIASGSWKKGSPVSFAQLRLLRVTYWGFDAKAHTGQLVVAASWAVRLAGVFHTLFDARFPFRRVELVDTYSADDDLSMSADNTSAFNDRYVSDTSTNWSMHAYGLAIDINPVENPYLAPSGVEPPNGRPYVDRSHSAKGMIHANDVVVKAFTAIGWQWGGDWHSTKDYQHFSSNGQ
jgi:hypothetical protein